MPSTALIGDVRARPAGWIQSAEDRGDQSGGDRGRRGQSRRRRDRRPGSRAPASGRISPSAEARRPSASPSTAPSRPSSTASRRTDPVIIQRPAPSVRSIPSLPRALEHGHVERVEDQEAADEQRHRGEEVEDHVEGLKLLLDVGGLALGASATLTPRARAGAAGRDPEMPGRLRPRQGRSRRSPRGLSISRRAGRQRHRGRSPGRRSRGRW